MKLDLKRVEQNVRSAQTEDLLDRATVYRAGMEPEALELIDEELQRRGVGPREIEAHRQEQKPIADGDGIALKCRLCSRPATAQMWGWHWMWGLLPLFPRQYAYCESHRPKH
jgi:hypothetical protein